MGQKYKRNPNLAQAYDDHAQDREEYFRLQQSWNDILLNNPSPNVLMKVADLLARLRIEPSQDGTPTGMPPITKTNPLALLDALTQSIRHSPNGAKTFPNGQRYDVFETLEWKADVLKAATLLWAGISWEEIREAETKAILMDAQRLLMYSDIEGFWQSKKKTRTDIQKEWQAGTFDIDCRILEKWLKRYKTDKNP